MTDDRTFKTKSQSALQGWQFATRQTTGLSRPRAKQLCKAGTSSGDRCRHQRQGPSRPDRCRHCETFDVALRIIMCKATIRIREDLGPRSSSGDRCQQDPANGGQERCTKLAVLRTLQDQWVQTRQFHTGRYYKTGTSSGDRRQQDPADGGHERCTELAVLRTLQDQGITTRQLHTGRHCKTSTSSGDRRQWEGRRTLQREAGAVHKARCPQDPADQGIQTRQYHRDQPVPQDQHFFKRLAASGKADGGRGGSVHRAHCPDTHRGRAGPGSPA